MRSQSEWADQQSTQSAPSVQTNADFSSFDASTLVPADSHLTVQHNNVPSFLNFSAFSTTAISPVDHGDFNMSVVTARGHGLDEQRVRENLHVLRLLCGRPLARLKQVHSRRVIDLDSYDMSDDGLAPLASVEADAMVTTKRDVALAILTGDCTPILFVDGVHHVFGAAHSGRLGTQRTIAAAVIEKMVAKGADASQIRVWIGPHICGNCYETGNDIASAFEKQFPGCSTHTRFGGAGVSLGRAITCELVDSGVISSHIYGFSEVDNSTLCTLENPRFYSYRGYTLTKDPMRDGRFYTVLCV